MKTIGLYDFPFLNVKHYPKLPGGSDFVALRICFLLSKHFESYIKVCLELQSHV